MPAPEPPNRFGLRDLQSVGLLSTVGITLVLCSAVGVGIGYWVDNRWHTAPWGIVVGFLFGTAAGFLELFHAVMKANEDD